MLHSYLELNKGTLPHLTTDSTYLRFMLVIFLDCIEHSSSFQKNNCISLMIWMSFFLTLRGKLYFNGFREDTRRENV